MKRNKDITRVGWLIVGAVLVLNGARLMVTREIYGRIRMAGQPPMLEGWPVFFGGLAELAVGVLLVIWYLRQIRN